MTNRTEIRRKLTDLKQQYGGESVFQALTDPDSADADRLTEGELMQLQQATELLGNEEIAHKLTGDESRAVEIGSPSTTASGGSITLVSRARPLTPSANADLQDYDPMRRVTADEIENPPLGVSDDTLVGYELGERPPEGVIDQYQLDVEDDTLPDNTPSDGPSDQFMEDNDMGVNVGGIEIRVPLKVGPWGWSSPSDDPQSGLGQGPTTVARWTIGPVGDRDAVVAVRGRGTNYRALYWPTGEQDERRTLFGPVGGVEVVRKTVDELEELPRAEETPQGTAAMQEAGLSNSEDKRTVIVAGEPGSRRYSFPDGTDTRDAYVPPSEYMDAIDRIESELGDANQYVASGNAGAVVISGSGELKRYEPNRPERDDRYPFDDQAPQPGDGGGTSQYTVSVERKSAGVKQYTLDGVSDFAASEQRETRDKVTDDIGPAAQFERGATVGRITLAGEPVRAVQFDPVDDLAAVADYDTNTTDTITRDVTATDISWAFDREEVDQSVLSVANKIIRQEFGEPTDYPDGTVVGTVSFDRTADGPVVTGVNQRLEGEPDDQQDVLETDLGGLSPEVDDDEQEQQQQRSTQGTLGGDSPMDPGEFPTEPDAEAQRKREQMRREEQQQDLEGDVPEFDPAADREAQERRERRAERTEEQLAEDQVDLLGENIESDDVLPAEQVDDDDDNQPGLSAFGGDDNGNGDSGN